MFTAEPGIIYYISVLYGFSEFVNFFVNNCLSSFWSALLVACPVSRASKSRSPGHEFETHIESRDYFKKKRRIVSPPFEFVYFSMYKSLFLPILF